MATGAVTERGPLGEQERIAWLEERDEGEPWEWGEKLEEVLPAVALRAAYAVSGTERAYGAMR
eukprot:2089592-Rhodomonas_salina.1